MKKNLSQLFDEATPEELEQLLADAETPALPQNTVANIQKKVQTAMGLQKKKRSFSMWKPMAVAACLVVIVGFLALAFGGGDGVVTSPGILTVMAYGADQTGTELALNAVTPYQYDNWLFVNWASGLPIVLSVSKDAYPSENITFQITVDGGNVFIGESGSTDITPGNAQKMDATFEIPNNTAIFWSQFTEDDTLWQDEQVAFMDIVIMDGETIIGYNCLRFDRTDADSMSFRILMVSAISFDSEENISQEILSDYIAQAHIN